MDVLTAIYQTKHKISKLDAEILLAHVLQIELVYLKSHPEKIISDQQLAKFYSLVTRRQDHEPIAYIVGNKDFWDLNLLITNDVLIPRQETEILVEQALIHLSTMNHHAKILELGTGSGAIALAIAKHVPNSMVIATDISSASLLVASSNAARLNINNIKFFVGNWFAALPKLSFKFDLIISNPPYIASNEVNLCDREVFYEPQAALFAEHNGMACFQEIILPVENYLKSNGYLLLEHGFQQKDQVADLLKVAKFTEINFFTDLSGLNRAVIAKKT